MLKNKKFMVSLILTLFMFQSLALTGAFSETATAKTSGSTARQHGKYTSPVDSAPTDGTTTSTTTQTSTSDSSQSTTTGSSTTGSTNTEGTQSTTTSPDTTQSTSTDSSQSTSSNSSTNETASSTDTTQSGTSDSSTATAPDTSTTGTTSTDSTQSSSITAPTDTTQSTTTDSSQTNAIVPSTTVTTNVDSTIGAVSTWDSIEASAAASGQSSTSIKIMQDENSFTFLITGTLLGPYYELFLDTDNNSATGYQNHSWSDAGCDWYIENGRLYQSTGTGWNWLKIGRGPVVSIVSEGQIEITLSKAAIGNPSGIKVGFWDVDSLWAKKSVLPTAGSKMAIFGEIPSAPVEPNPMNLLIPAYFDPGPEWDAMTLQAGRMPGRVWAIANMHNGPSTAVEPEYVVAIDKMRANGGRVLGYIFSLHGTRPLEEVKADIDNWYGWYNIDGIFIDELANTGYEDYYQQIYDYIKSKNSSALVVSNTGHNTTEGYLMYNGRRTADVLCIFESDTGFMDWTPSTWTKNYAPSNFAILSEATAAGQMADHLNKADESRIGWAYITDDMAPSTWDTLTSYFDQLCTAVAATA